MAYKERAQGVQVFKSVQVLRKQAKNQNNGTLLRPVMVPKQLGPNLQMPNCYPNDFGKFRKFRSVQLLRKQFINKNMTRRVRKRGA